jgi:hypothetical protein
MDSDSDNGIHKGPAKLFYSQLRKSEDWEHWFFDLKHTAQNLRIWSLLNPDLPNVPAGLTPPLDTGPTLLENTDLEQKLSYKVAQEKYDADVVKWEKKARILTAIESTIKATVDMTYQ